MSLNINSAWQTIQTAVDTLSNSVNPPNAQAFLESAASNITNTTGNQTTAFVVVGILVGGFLFACIGTGVVQYVRHAAGLDGDEAMRLPLPLQWHNGSAVPPRA